MNCNAYQESIWRNKDGDDCLASGARRAQARRSALIYSAPKAHIGFEEQRAPPHLRTHSISREGQITIELRGMLTQIEGFDAAASRHPRRKTYGVNGGHVRAGGGETIGVQSMPNT